MISLIGLSGSLRRGSYNSAVLRAAASVMPSNSELHISTIAGIPLYDGDVERDSGIPKCVVELKDAIAAADKRMRHVASRLVLVDETMRQTHATQETLATLRNDRTAEFPSGVVDGAVQEMARSLVHGSIMLNSRWASPGAVYVGGQDPCVRLFMEWYVLSLRCVPRSHE